MAKSEKSNSVTKTRIVPTLAKAAQEIGVSLAAIQKWRAVGMPGSPGRWDVQAIIEWRESTARRGVGAETPIKGNGTSSDVREELIRAQARKEDAVANMKQREDAIQEGGLCYSSDVNRFLSECFNELRTIAKRLPHEFAAGYSKAQQSQLRDDLDKRVDLMLIQFHDWIERTAELDVREE